jgi:hypothetical protein
MFKSRLLIFSLCLMSFNFAQSQQIDEALALHLSRMPLTCIPQQWPNKTSHLSDTITDHRLTPAELHPAFFGCLDWHSSVHGHWLLVKILKTYPNIANKDSILSLLDNSIQPEKIREEAAYFTKYTGSTTFERTYGWAWLLKLDEELLTWDVPEAKKWHANLQPLTQIIVRLWKDFLPKQTYPNRTGVHPNTAFGLAFALDWARESSDSEFEKLIIEKAKDFYADNRNVPAYFEPDGSDFFSPSLEAADLMRRIYDPQTFTKWFDNYYEERSIARLLELPVVSDRKDYQIVHLDGLAFSRAWCLKGIASHLYQQPAKSELFKAKAADFIKNALPNISHDNYGGSHWLASFAFYALQ